jgi:hypothetical protein
VVHKQAFGALNSMHMKFTPIGDHAGDVRGDKRVAQSVDS